MPQLNPSTVGHLARAITSWQAVRWDHTTSWTETVGMFLCVCAHLSVHTCVSACVHVFYISNTRVSLIWGKRLITELQPRIIKWKSNHEGIARLT